MFMANKKNQFYFKKVLFLRNILKVDQTADLFYQELQKTYFYVTKHLY